MKVEQLGASEVLDPKTMLLQAADEADQYEEVVIVARKKDGGAVNWTTSKYSWMLFGAAAVMTDMAMKSLNGNIEDA